MKFLKLVIVAVMLSLLVACSISNSNEEKVYEEGYPITMVHALGETVIESKPEKVVSINVSNQDTALALGIVPVAVSGAITEPIDENGLNPWTSEKIIELDGEMPIVFDDVLAIEFKQIYDIEPDVILAAYSTLVQEDYDFLSKMAPVVSYTTASGQTLWREEIALNSEGLGLKEEGLALIEELETLIANKNAQYLENQYIEGAFVWFNTIDLSSFYLYTTFDPRASYLADLGVSFPNELEVLNEDNALYIAIDASNIEALYNLDILVTYGDASMLETLQNDEMLSQVPAIANSAVVFIEDSSDILAATIPSALSIPYAIDEYLGLIAEVIK